MKENRTDNVELLYPELSYSIIGAAMDVHNGLGPGWDEWDYHRAMIEALQKQGHAVLSHDRKDLMHQGVAVDRLELDLLVDNSVILELKHIKSNFHPTHYTQIINYLKRWEKRLGVLINFGLERLRYQRVPFSFVQGTIGYTGHWNELHSGCHEVLASAMDAILCEYGLGYGVDLYKKLLRAELVHKGVEAAKASLSPRLDSLCLGERTVDAILVGSELMVMVSASSTDTTATDLSYLKTYMGQAGIHEGILVNIGNSEVQLRGVR